MSYLKGKDIKQQGDCLVYCYTRRIDIVMFSNDDDGEITATARTDKPEGFEKW